MRVLNAERQRSVLNSNGLIKTDADADIQTLRTRVASVKNAGGRWPKMDLRPGIETLKNRSTTRVLSIKKGTKMNE